MTWESAEDCLGNVRAIYDGAKADYHNYYPYGGRWGYLDDHSRYQVNGKEMHYTDGGGMHKDIISSQESIGSPIKKNPIRRHIKGCRQPAPLIIPNALRNII